MLCLRDKVVLHVFNSNYSHCPRLLWPSHNGCAISWTRGSYPSALLSNQQCDVITDACLSCPRLMSYRTKAFLLSSPTALGWQDRGGGFVPAWYLPLKSRSKTYKRPLHVPRTLWLYRDVFQMRRMKDLVLQLCWDFTVRYHFNIELFQ